MNRIHAGALVPVGAYQATGVATSTTIFVTGLPFLPPEHAAPAGLGNKAFAVATPTRAWKRCMRLDAVHPASCRNHEIHRLAFLGGLRLEEVLAAICACAIQCERWRMYIPTDVTPGLDAVYSPGTATMQRCQRWVLRVGIFAWTDGDYPAW